MRGGNEPLLEHHSAPVLADLYHQCGSHLSAANGFSSVQPALKPGGCLSLSQAEKQSAAGGRNSESGNFLPVSQMCGHDGGPRIQTIK